MKEEKKPDAQQLINLIRFTNDLDEDTRESIAELLKKEIPQEMEAEGGGATWWLVCPECHGAIDNVDNYCRHCGQRVTL